MALEKFGIEGGLGHFTEDGDLTVCRLFGAGTPGGDGGEQDAAVIGTRYINETDGSQWYKDATGGNDVTDWVKIANQDQIDAINCQSSANAITTVQTVDSVVVDDYAAVDWLLILSLDSAPEDKIIMQVVGFHDGETGGDATDAKHSISHKMKFGSAFDHDVDVDVSGAAGAQVMNLKVTAAAAISARAVCRKIESDI